MGELARRGHCRRIRGPERQPRDPLHLGEIELVDDIYGHEKLIQKGFDGLAHTIVKPSRSLDKYLAGRVGRSQVAGNQFKPKKNKAWMRNIWGN